jgi:hypothetical protein
MFSWSELSALGSGRKRMPNPGMSSKRGTPRLVRAALSATW